MTHTEQVIMSAFSIIHFLIAVIYVYRFYALKKEYKLREEEVKHYRLQAGEAENALLSAMKQSYGISDELRREDAISQRPEEIEILRDIALAIRKGERTAKALKDLGQ